MCHKEGGAALPGGNKYWNPNPVNAGKLDIETRWAQEVIERQGKPRHWNQAEMHAKSEWPSEWMQEICWEVSGGGV